MKKKAKEDILIFRYSPNGAESVQLEVDYDDQVDNKNDELNTVYFVDDSSNTAESSTESTEKKGFKLPFGK